MLETLRLLIDDIKESDKASFFENISHDKNVLDSFMCSYTETIESLDFSKYISSKNIFAIRLKSKPYELIGIFTIFNIENNSLEIGYALGSKHWNKGYMSEAFPSFIKYIFSNMNIETVYAGYFTGNDASKRVMEKSGMKYDHFIKNELTYLSIPRDVTYYRIDK